MPRLCRLQRPERHGAVRVHSPGAARQRRAHRHPLLRRLPLRPAPGPQRLAQHRLSLPPRARDRRPGGRGGSGRQALPGGGLGGRGLPRGQLPRLRRMQRGSRGVLQERRDADLQRQGPADRRGHAGRLLVAHRRARGFRAAHARGPRPGACRAVALRRHHDLFAAAALERGPGLAGGRRGPRRPGAHGRQAGECAGCRSHGDHALGCQG